MPNSRQSGGSADQTSRVGVYAVGLVIERKLGWIFREQSTSDFGVDAHIEVREESFPTGALVGLQIKSGPSYLRELSGDCIVFRDTQQHFEYWLNHVLPIVVVIHDAELSRSYWQVVTASNVVSTGKRWKLRVPRSQCLEDADETQIGSLRRIASAQLRMVGRASVELNSGDPKTGSIRVLIEEGSFESAIAEVKQQIRTRPNDPRLWEALAWSQYNLLAYPEALASINRALRLDKASEEARGIRACIFAEQGIERHDTALIERARAEFELLARDSIEWFDHYNLANTLRELGHSAQAESEYRMSVTLNPRAAEVWTNLGTLLRSLHRHDEEIECFEKALEISPGHPHALVNKGIYLTRYGRDPKRGAELIESVLSSNTMIASRDPITWYWLIDAHRRARQFDDAIRVASTALEQHPTNVSLTRAQLNLYGDLWRTASTRLQESIEQFAIHLEKWPLDYSVRAELVRAHAAGGEMDKAWRVLLDSFEALDLGNVVAKTMTSDIEAIGISIEDCITAFKFLPQYAEFRRESPANESLAVQVYIGASKSRPAELTDPERIVHRLGAIPFGLAYNFLSNLASAPDSELYTQLDILLREPIKQTLILLTRYFSREVDEVRHDTELLSAALTDMMLMLSYAALIELSRQLGWLVGVLGASNIGLRVILDEYDQSDVLSEVATESVFRLNRELHFIPRSSNGAAEGDDDGRGSSRDDASN